MLSAKQCAPPATGRIRVQVALGRVLVHYRSPSVLCLISRVLAKYLKQASKNGARCARSVNCVARFMLLFVCYGTRGHKAVLSPHIFYRGTLNVGHFCKLDSAHQ